MTNVGGDAAATAVELALETLARRGQLFVRATGASMLPALWPGDELEIRSNLSGQLSVGDIACFVRDGRLFIHRIVLTSPEGLITQGDALASADPLVRHCDVLGRVVAVHRGGRTRPFANRGTFLGIGRALLRRSTFATRMALRWHRATSTVST